MTDIIMPPDGGELAWAWQTLREFSSPELRHALSAVELRNGARGIIRAAGGDPGPDEPSGEAQEGEE